MPPIRWISEQWRSSHRFRIVVITSLVVLLVIFLYPFETTTVPQWNLRVIDDAGAPVPEINVTEHWQNYLLESGGHEEAQTTDQNGRVNFDARNIRASVASRLLARLRKLGNHNPGGRPVLYGAVVVWGSKSHETTVAMHQGEGTPQWEIRVQRRFVR